MACNCYSFAACCVDCCISCVCYSSGVLGAMLVVSLRCVFIIVVSVKWWVVAFNLMIRAVIHFIVMLVLVWNVICLTGTVFEVILRGSVL